MISRIATGRESHARQVKGDDPDKAGGWGEAKNLTSVKKVLLLISLIMDTSWIIVVKWQRKVIRIMTSTFLLEMYSLCRKQEC
jgi:hypothetical protein